MREINTILVPVDFSPHVREALDFAIDLARRFGASLRVLHVLETAVMAMPSFGAPAATGLPGESEEGALGRLAALVARVQDSGVAIETALARDLPPPDAIVADAAECGADLVVMATHGRSGLGRVLMGSVTEHVVRRAPCAVLTVRAETC